MKNRTKILSLFVVLLIFLASPAVFASEVKYEKLSAEDARDFLENAKTSNHEILMDMTYQLGNFVLMDYDEDYNLIIYNKDYDRVYKVKKSDEFLTFWDDKEDLSCFMELGADTKSGRAYGFMDVSGKVVIEPKWELGDKFFGDVAGVAMFGDDGKFMAMSLIDKEGNVLTDKTYPYIERFMMPESYEEPLVEHSFFNMFESEFLTEYEPVDYAFFMEEEAKRYDGKAKYSTANAVVRGGAKGLMDKKGNVLFPAAYGAVQVGDNDIISVRLDEKWGYVNPKGEIILPLQYDYTSRFRDGLAAIILEQPAIDPVIAFIDEDFNIVQDFKKAPKWDEIFGVGDIDGLKKVFLDGGEYENVSSWARSDVYLANSIGIVSEELQKKYKSNITREEFCEMLVLMLMENTSKNVYGNVGTPYYGIQNSLIEEAAYKALERFASGEHIFSDTDSFAVEVAYEMGIVSGTSATAFSPDAEITRQEAAVMLMRADSICRGEALPSSKENLERTYNDADEIADWAGAYAQLAYERNVMEGVGNKMFAPKAKYTVEQSIATIIRLYEGI